MWRVNCKCGHTGEWASFSVYVGRALVADQWRCPACECAWKVTKDGVKILRPPKREQASA